jgi:hypothetical protein
VGVECPLGLERRHSDPSLLQLAVDLIDAFLRELRRAAAQVVLGVGYM